MRKSTKATLWIGGAALALFIALFAFQTVRNGNFSNQATSALLDARQMEMVTTPQEAAALSPSVPEAENAAPLYRDLAKAKSRSDGSKLLSEWSKNPSPETRRAIEGYLNESAEFITLAERAAAKPSCWFNRDYEQGYAMLFPELAPMKLAVQNFCLRATLAYQDGRSEDALKDLMRARQVTLHMDSELSDIGILVALAGRSVLVRTLAPLAAQSPQSSPFRSLLIQVVKENKPRSITDFLRFSLLNDLLMLEQTTTKELRQKHGYGDMQVKPGFIFTSLFMGDAEGRLMVIEGHKKLWELASQKVDSSDPRVVAADQQIAKGMMSNPYSGEAYAMATDSGMGMDGASMAWFPTEKYELARLSMAVVERIVSSGGDPLKVKIDDLQPKSGGKLAVWSADGRIHIGPETQMKSQSQGQFTLPMAR